MMGSDFGERLSSLVARTAITFVVVALVGGFVAGVLVAL